jgi:signal transduction histidine kinase
MAFEETTAADLSCRVALGILFYFEHQYGRARMEEVYAGIEGAPPLSYIRDLNNWISVDFGMHMLDAFAEASGDPDFALKAGRFGISPEALGFVYYMFRALATPRTAFERIVSVCRDANRAGDFTIDRITDRHMVMRYQSKRREPTVSGCRVRQGQFTEVPTLWGLPRARLVHTQCQTLGAEACVYELSWTPYSSSLWRVLCGALTGGGAGLLLAHPFGWILVPTCAALGGSTGLALGYRATSSRSLKLLADQEESLAQSIRDLGHRFDEIRQLNQTLEQKVEARTRELSVASDQLKDALARQAELLDSEKRARLEAEQANRAKDHFLATLSHELRTPLTSMLMHASLLSRRAEGDEELERGTASIRRSIDTQTRLVDDLLDISRIASGKLVLSRGPVELGEVVADAVAMARPVAEGKSVTLEADTTLCLGTVLGDANRLQQIVGNLLTNAIKFTPRGGRIQVRAAHVDGNAQIEVADNGMGIRPDFLPQLFRRFVQADTSVTRTYGGLGLGLALVRHLVEAHGGAVCAESAGEGKGATFRVILPLLPDESRPARPANPARAPAHHDIRGVRAPHRRRQRYARFLRVDPEALGSGRSRRPFRHGGPRCARGVPATGRPLRHRDAGGGRLELHPSCPSAASRAGRTGARGGSHGSHRRRRPRARAGGGFSAQRDEAHRSGAAGRGGLDSGGIGERKERGRSARFVGACE